MEHLHLDEKMTFKWPLSKLKGVDWTYLPQGRVQWRVFMLNLQFYSEVWRKYSYNESQRDALFLKFI